MDDKLSWIQHITQLCKKLSSTLYVLRRLKHVSNDDSVRTAYFALFDTHIRYGLAAWGGSSKTNIQRVLKMQKKAIRILAGLGPQESCREAFRDLRILTTVSMYILVTTMHALKQDTRRGQDYHSYNTRSADNFVIPSDWLLSRSCPPTN